MEKFMAEFGQGYVQTPFLSESNSVRYKISIAGSCPLSTAGPYVKFQDNPIGSQTFSAGLHLRVFDPSTGALVDSKSYAFSTSNDTTSAAFVSFMNSLTNNRLVAILTSGKVNFPPEVVSWLRAAGTAAFPSDSILSRFDVSYAAFYTSSKRVIALEHVKLSNRKSTDDYQTILDVVFDSLEDVGATGFPRRTYENVKQFMSAVGGTNNEIARLPTSAAISKLSDYNLIPGDVLYLKAQLYADADLLALGTTNISIRFYNASNGYISSTQAEFTGQAGSWELKEDYVVVPENAVGFTIYAQRTAQAGQGGMRNLSFSEVSRNGGISKPAEFGVNGIRVNYICESASPPDIMVLPTQASSKTGKVFGQEFREV